MGVKVKSRILAVLIAVTLIATSAIGVFAASSSPVKGAISGGSAVVNSTTSGTASWSPKENADHYNVYLNGTLVAENVKSTSVKLNLKKDKHYTVSVEAVNKSGEKSDRTVIGHICTYKKASKVKAKRAGKGKIKVTWKKAKKVKSYRIVVYKNGKYVKTVKAGKNATSKTIKKLTKGAKYKFIVYPVCKKGYDSIRKTSNTVKCK